MAKMITTTTTTTVCLLFLLGLVAVAGFTQASPTSNHGFYGIFGNNKRISKKASVADEETTTTTLPSKENLGILTSRGREALLRLIENDKDNAQTHVYGDWPPAGTEDDGKRQLCEQLADLDDTYPGGLNAYLSKAKTLLRESADGVNPFSEYRASIPRGESLCYEGRPGSTMSFSAAEQLGIQACGHVVFCLVAGGLGERLGYSDIKLNLETNLCTNVCYLKYYIKYIRALEYLAKKKTSDVQIPLVIMTSLDTDAATKKLLNDNDYFGMPREQIILLTQDKVAALKNVHAGLALDTNRWSIQTKPHGHGDVHHLIYKSGLLDEWEKQGKTHIVFLQDTNALVINSVVPTLGVSVAKKFHMNSICIPRLAGEAAGAIAELTHTSDPSKNLVINVEYNQLDPLLRSQEGGQGDVPDETTGYSPYPGNANNLVLELGAYAKTLRGKDQGVVVEFVNPKYTDESRTAFIKPTRLECMMQDIPKLFQKEISNVNIGFTMFQRWFTFSPAKNALEAGVAAVAKGNAAPGTLSSAESDKYIQNQRKLKFAGVKLAVTEDVYEQGVVVGGIPVTKGPRIIMCPSFAITQEELLQKVRGKNITITQRSSMVLEGHYLKIKDLHLDGALVIRTGEESRVVVDGLVVNNEGWELQELNPDEEYPEEVRIRGYTMNKKETAEYLIYEPGNFVIGSDGKVRKVEE